jgi:transposase
MSLSELLLPPESDVLITEMTMTEDLLVVVATPLTTSACCPLCASSSDRTHSRYRRTVADLPFGDRSLVVRLLVRRFKCGNAGCRRAVFCERLPKLVDAYARSTNRLKSLQRAIGTAVGGEAGSRLAEELTVPVSGDTLIRRVRMMPTEPEPVVRCLGIDDFAFRRGHEYGTILIDLERGRVIDILKTRESSDIEVWLKAHPGIEVITRDRASAYANAASDGAPQAKQVADRWHLLKNLRETAERLLDRRRKIVQKHLKSQPPPAAELDFPTFQDGSVPEEPKVPELSAREQARESKRQEKVEYFIRVHDLHAAGESIRQIAMNLDLDRETVARYLQADSFPDRQAAPRVLVKYRDYLDRCLNEGRRNAAELHRELIAAGLSASYYSVRRYVRRRLVALGRASEADAPIIEPRIPSAKQLSFMIIRKPDERDEEEQSRVETLTGIDEEMSNALELVVMFAAMVRGTLALTLKEWLTKADASVCAEVRGFAKTLRQDEAAVQAGMTEPWSNGPVEGQVNRLKMIKRQMYGRAGFELLRARVRAA